jgi:hypothetical protein
MQMLAAQPAVAETTQAVVVVVQVVLADPLQHLHLQAAMAALV